jgi:hydrogenase expression/formation protein HypE
MSAEAGMISLACPIPISEYPTVTLAHGSGGRLSQMLVERIFIPAFRNAALETLHDGALVTIPGGQLAFTTDSYVITPRFFPGGDIGSLAVHGTVNDLAMCGAMPLALSAGFILEEGLPMDELWRIVMAMAQAAGDAGVSVTTGDTKVVDRGRGDGVYINVSGVGIVPEGIRIAPQLARPGDRILLSGRIAEHGIAIMSVREGLAFETELVSDSAALNTLVAGVLSAAGAGVHVLRDPTRGGVSSALNEIAAAARVGINLSEASIPISDPVRGACEILGLDPLYVANEGKCLVVVEPGAAEPALDALRAHPLGRDAAEIGEVTAEHTGRVVMRSLIGGQRIVDMISGEQLPRIC